MTDDEIRRIINALTWINDYAPGNLINNVRPAELITALSQPTSRTEA